MKRKRLVVIGTLMLLFNLVLTACGSFTETTANTTKNAEEQKVEEATTEMEAEEVTETVAETEEVVAEEITPVVYDGIDMESTLPGIEWIETFVGIIDEPKIVAFNDATNKKVIVEEGQTVEFEETDTMAVYIPDGVEWEAGKAIIGRGSIHEHSHEILDWDEEILEEEKSISQKLGGVEFYAKLRKDGVEQKISCIIDFVE